MKLIILSFFLVLSGQVLLPAQSLYFPPLNGNDWDTTSPISLGWCQERIDAMYEMLEDNHTKAFIVLKDGKMVLEKYFGTFQQDSIWYWASAGKSLTACLVGLALQDGFLSMDDPTNQYLGHGWTSCTSGQEEAITVLHQLTMTSGLDDGWGDPYCTLDTCLHCKADPGTRWAYHNAPYTLLDGVIENATGQNLNLYFQQSVRNRTGITGLFVQVDYNNVFFSRPRSMARFGLWMLNKGNWNGDPILTDTAYVNQMLNTSQNLNQSYGYLWWLNGKPSYMLPGLQFTFPGSLMPHAPEDMMMALGKNGQYVNVVPSLNMVVIRMGNAPEGTAVPVTLNDVIWEHLSSLDCTTSASNNGDHSDSEITVYPNPSHGHFHVSFPDRTADLYIYDATGK